MPTKAGGYELTKNELAAKKIHEMTAPGTPFNCLGRVENYALIRHAAAGVSLVLKLPLDEAEELLVNAVHADATCAS